MARMLQDIKLRPTGPHDVLWETPLADGETMENVVHERMSDHFATKAGIDAVQVVDDETGDVLYRWTFSEEALAIGERLRNRLAKSAEAELQRREGKPKDA